LKRSRPYLVALLAVVAVGLVWWFLHATGRPHRPPVPPREVPAALLDQLRARGYAVGRELPDREDNARRGWWVTVGERDRERLACFPRGRAAMLSQKWKGVMLLKPLDDTFAERQRELWGECYVEVGVCYGLGDPGLLAVLIAIAR
jgi:hypothetical protein